MKYTKFIKVLPTHEVVLFHKGRKETWSFG